MMKIQTIISSIIILSGLYCCTGNYAKNEQKNEIKIGEYSFTFPKDFELRNDSGLDSYVGKVGNEQIEFSFDYGYYSNSLVKSFDEYINQWVWKSNALGNLNYSAGSSIDAFSEHKNVYLLSYSKIDSNLFQLLFDYKNDTLKYQLNIPKDILQAEVDLDTLDGIAYKLVNYTGEDENYVGLYAKNLNRYNKTINSYPSLSIRAYDLNKTEIKIALSILRSCVYVGE